MNQPQNRLAVIGSGVAGITASHLLQQRYDVTLYEKNNRLGGHTNTVILESGPDAGVAVDTGFIVLNDQTYPLLHQLLAEWNCPVRFSDMSFGYYSEKTGFYYAGTGLSGLFARRRNWLEPSFYGFLWEILKFGKQAVSDLDAGRVGNQTLGDYVRHLSPRTVQTYIVPMAAAIWSATQSDILGFPAESLLRFWRNHGLLMLKNRPRWQTVHGGSHRYLHAFTGSFRGAIRLEAKIARIVRQPDRVEIHHHDGRMERYDGVVLATHADQALALLDEATPDERRLLGPWRYQANRTMLHTDISFLPSERRAWASWNYVDHRSMTADTPVSVSYWMNLLQGIQTRQNYIVTLNPHREPHPGALVRDILYHHPVFDREAVATQAELPALQGKNRTWFCGSYFGHGFHEDAVRSAVDMVACHGIPFPGRSP